MPILTREPESKRYTPAPEGLHVACCCDVVDLGLVDAGFGLKHHVELRWMLEDAAESGRFIARRRYTNSLNEKAALRKDLETWRGRGFSREELRDGFDLEKLIGVGCQLQIAHRITDQGKTFANVQAVIPLAKGQFSPGIDPSYTRERDRPTKQQTDDDHVPF